MMNNQGLNVRVLSYNSSLNNTPTSILIGWSKIVQIYINDKIAPNLEPVEFPLKYGCDNIEIGVWNS